MSEPPREPRPTLRPPGTACCIFFGPTPASFGDEPRAASPVNPIGHISEDCSELTELDHSEPIVIEAMIAPGPKYLKRVEKRGWLSSIGSSGYSRASFPESTCSSDITVSSLPPQPAAEPPYAESAGGFKELNGPGSSAAFEPIGGGVEAPRRVGRPGSRT